MTLYCYKSEVILWPFARSSGAMMLRKNCCVFDRSRVCVIGTLGNRIMPINGNRRRRYYSRQGLFRASVKRVGHPVV